MCVFVVCVCVCVLTQVLATVALCHRNAALPVAMDWIGLDWIGSDWIGLDWVGLDWIGLDWIGLGWIGLDWIGPRHYHWCCQEVSSKAKPQLLQL